MNAEYKKAAEKLLYGITDSRLREPAIWNDNHHLHLFALFGQQQKKGVKVLSNSILRVPEK